jgi:hypothetical protein
VIWINIIKKVKTSFDNISRISEIILILGQLFILFLLLGSLSYIVFNLYIIKNTGAILDLLLVGTLIRYNAIVTLAIIWGGALFIDYIEKHGKTRDK